MLYKIDMTKFKSEMLNKIASSRGTANRGAVHLYLDKDVYAEFKKTIDPLAVGEVIETFMREIVETEKRKKKE